MSEKPTDLSFDAETNTLKWTFSEGSTIAKVQCKLNENEQFCLLADYVQSDSFKLHYSVGTYGELQVCENRPDPGPPFSEWTDSIFFEVKNQPIQ